MDDLQDRLGRIAARMEGITEAFAHADRAGHVAAEGVDEAGAVTVAVDPDGVVVAITPSSAWRDRVGAEGLGAAIVSAAMAAQSVRMQSWGDAVIEQVDHLRGADRSPPPAPGPSGHAAGPTPREAEVAERVRTALAEANRAAAAVFEGTTAASDTGPTGSDTRGHVRLTTGPGGRGLAAVDIDPAWAADASLRRLADTLAEALATARESMPDDGPDPTRPPTEADDPLALLQRVLEGLPGTAPTRSVQDGR